MATVLDAKNQLSEFQHKLERSDVALGFLPLNDCAPIVVAHELGLFAAAGLNVNLLPQRAWATVRDRLALGALDAAQMMSGMLFSTTLGLRGVAKHLVTSFSFGLNGNAITLSNRLLGELGITNLGRGAVSASVLKPLLEKRGNQPITLAHVYPVSTHNYLLRAWLTAGGIHPDRDVQLTVLPPEQMVAYMDAGMIDGYCVGEPWNQLAVDRGVGSVVATGYDIWNNAPDKLLAVRADWAEENPNTHKALIAAMLKACQWLDDPENRKRAAVLLQPYFPQEIKASVIAAPFEGRVPVAEGQVREIEDFHVFHRYAANFPWKSHGLWTMAQMYRWGQLTQPMNVNTLVDRVYQPGVYRDVAMQLGVSVPSADHKIEGVNQAGYAGAGDVALGSDLMMGENQFQPGGWLDAFGAMNLHSRMVDLSSLRVANGYDA